MNISSETVKELREKTGAGMMDCKRALVETSGNMEKALDQLRKQGLVKAANRSTRIAAEGMISMAVDGDAITMVEVNCETDFVCKTDDFQNYVKSITLHIIKTKPASIDALLSSSMNSQKISDTQTALVAKIGENIGVRRFAIKTGVKKGTYIHAGSKIGVVVTFDDPSNKLTNEIARDVAMHVAAMDPQYVRKTDVPESFIAKEKKLYAEQVANEKKPAEVLEKIIAGKLNKNLADICLEDQLFVKDPLGKQTVAQMLKGCDPQIKIKEFVRYQVGEGMKSTK